MLLSDSKGVHNNPLLLEIKVSHKCSEEKLCSGLKIIEIGIDSEEDIKILCSSGKCIIEENDKNIFVGFEEEKISSRDFLTHFSLYKSGAAYADEHICCATQLKPNSVSEFLIDDTTPFCFSYSKMKIGLTYAKMLGHTIKNCELCKYSCHDYENRKLRCNLHKKCNTPLNPMQRCANDCLCYRIDKAEENTIKQAINTGKINIVRIK